jgi:hypothetical protein
MSSERLRLAIRILGVFFAFQGVITVEVVVGATLLAGAQRLDEV